MSAHPEPLCIRTASRPRTRRAAVLFLIALLTLSSIAPLQSGERRAGGRAPNIVLIFADDLGWKDVGYQGTDFYETPRIDALAKQGMVFTDGYASAGNCAPSRACLISGQYTPRHHVYAVGSTNRGPKQLMRMIPVPNKTSLDADNLTVAEALKQAGYRTGIFGKWHLGYDKGHSPTDQGFDVYFDSRRPNPNKARPKEKQDPKGIFSLTEKACEFMEQNRDRPFFAYVAHHAIHSALESRPDTLSKFKAKPSEGLQHKSPPYAGCTYDLDAGVGVLLDKLKELGLEENTLVVFTSDNGATPQSSQEPLRGNKGSYFEGGVREPFIVRWPGVTKPGTKCDVPVINVDLYPTFLDAAGAETPKDKVLDGESLVPLLKGEPALKREAIFWHFPGYLDRPVTRGRDKVFRTRPVSVIRKGDWKLFLYHEEWQLDGGRAKIDANNSVELYNLAEDIGERKNIAKTEIAKRDELVTDLLDWHDRTGAMLPKEENPKYDPTTPGGKKKRR